MIDTALDSKNPWLTGIDRERLQREGHVRLSFLNNRSDHGATGVPPVRHALDQLTGETPVAPTLLPFLPFANGNLATASGKAELYSESVRPGTPSGSRFHAPCRIAARIPGQVLSSG